MLHIPRILLQVNRSTLSRTFNLLIRIQIVLGFIVCFSSFFYCYHLLGIESLFSLKYADYATFVHVSTIYSSTSACDAFFQEICKLLQCC